MGGGHGQSCSLGLVRIFLGVILVLDVLVRSSNAEVHYSSKGILPTEAMLDMDNPTMFSIHFMHPSLLFQRTLFLIQIFFHIMFLVGYKTTQSSVISWLFLVSLHNRNILILNSGDDLLRLFMFWGLFLPLGNCFSIDSYLYSEQERPSSICIFAWKLQLAWMYFQTYILKTGPLWEAGVGAIHALSDIQFTTHFGNFVLLNSPQNLLILGSHITLVVEVLLPFLILCSNIPCNTMVRKWSEILGVFTIFLVFTLHFTFALTMEIGFFPFIPMAAVLIVLPNIFWEKNDRLSGITDSTHSSIIISGKHNWEHIVLILCKISRRQSIFRCNDKLPLLLLELDKNDDRKTVTIVHFIREIAAQLSFHPINLIVFSGIILFLMPVAIFIWIMIPCCLVVLWVIVCCFAVIGLLDFMLGTSVYETLVIYIYATYGLFFCMTSRSEGQYKSQLKKTFCFVAIIYVGFFVSQPHVEYRLPLWEYISWIGSALRLDQYWGMFTPDPPYHTGYWTMPSIIETGTDLVTVDLFANQFSQHPFGVKWCPILPWPCEDTRLSIGTQNITDILPSEAYNGQRWRKYFMNMRLEIFQPFLEHYMEFICIQWDENMINNHGRLQTVSLHFHSRQIISPAVFGQEEATVFKFSTINC